MTNRNNVLKENPDNDTVGKSNNELAATAKAKTPSHNFVPSLASLRPGRILL